MKLFYKKEGNEPISSFFVKRIKEPVLDINWHFHEEYEIICILQGNGVRLVGDNLSNFQSGELVLVGPNIPHLWRTTPNISSVDRIIIKFDELPGGVNLFSLPEFERIKTLLTKSETGVSFGPRTREEVQQHIISLSNARGIQKWICLLTILKILSKSSEIELLSSPYMNISPQKLEENRLSKVITYISENYYKDINLKDMADIASMTLQSFCRFFKKRTNKTFVQFLNEYRIGKACVLLIENKLSVTEICYELGFNSSTNFNRVFKKMYDCTPMEYRKKYSRGSENAVLV